MNIPNSSLGFRPSAFGFRPSFGLRVSDLRRMSSLPSIRTEDSLLRPELLDQVIAADVPGQKPADLGLEPKRNPSSTLSR